MGRFFSNGAQRELEMVNFLRRTVLMLILTVTFGLLTEVIIVFKNLTRLESSCSSSGSLDSKVAQFNNPRQVAVDKDVKFLYVVDSKNNRIQKFDTNGTFVKRWGTSGSGTGEFDLPVIIIMDSKGDLIVNDRGNNHVKNLMPTVLFF